MQLTMLPAPRRLYLVGSDGGRGPCDRCGSIAELVQVVEDGAGVKRLLDTCFPCAARPARPLFVARAA